MKVKCPSCGKITEYSLANPTRPFCSERCQLIDLGAWAEEKYKVPVSRQDSPSVNENSGDENDERDFLSPKHHLN